MNGLQRGNDARHKAANGRNIIAKRPRQVLQELHIHRAGHIAAARNDNDAIFNLGLCLARQVDVIISGAGRAAQIIVAKVIFNLDAVADHPSTKRFISEKLLQKFITETPTPEMIQAVVDRWTATGGSNLEVLKKVLEFTTLMDPDKVGNKIKTPFEQFAATYRATRADTSTVNLGTLYNYLARMQMLPHLKSEPTGYGELARDWVNTNDLLERQNFAWDVTTQLAFLEDIIQLLADNGLTAASPPGSIVDFYSNILFGGALTPYERQRAIDFLSSDDNGVPAAVTDDRIRKMVAFMIGFPQYLEQ